MDPRMAAIMLFFLVMTMLIGGMFLFIPLAKRLGMFLEHKLQDKSRVPDAALQEIKRLSASVEALQLQVRSLADRQEFVENILDSRRSRPTLLEKGE